jgi:hypothetical protein
VDPTQLQVATGQAPNLVAYAALNVPSQPAGFSYADPVTRVRIWKVTSATVPTANGGAGHDYAEGGNQVSRGWGTNSNTHTILIRGDGMDYYLVDFTRGVGFTNYRRLTVQPARDLCATFSNKPATPRILYILTGPQLVRYNTATMTPENTGFFPLSFGANAFGWLHQDKNDGWFVGAVVNDVTMFAFNARTGQYLTHTDSWGRMEPHLERDGRYNALLGGTSGPIQWWDLSTNTFGPVQQAGSGTGKLRLSHGASLRGFWVSQNDYTNFDHDRYWVSDGLIVKSEFSTASSMGSDSHEAGNWIQDDADLGGDLTKQWVIVEGVGALPGLTWNQANGMQRIDGGEQPRLISHHYSTNPKYWDYPFTLPSPDGKVIIFNSNMLSSGRYDLFVAEMPLR